MLAALSRSRAGRRLLQLTTHRASPVLVVTAGYVVSRALAFAAGARFDRSPLTYFWQFLDPYLLRHDLLRSLWWFHAQPPLFNAYLGTVVHVPNTAWTFTFQLVAYGVGLASALALFALLRAVGIPRWTAAVVTLLVIVAPDALVYELLLFYPHYVSALLVIGFVLLHRYLACGDRRAGAGAFACFGVLVLTRSSYQVLWLIAVGAVVAWLGPRARRRETVVLALVPTLLALAWMAKNEAQVGTFSTSSWIGINAARVTLTQADRNDLAKMVDRHELSLQALIPPFSDPELYGAATQTPTGVAALDELRKRGTHEVNFNNPLYARASRQYLKDSLKYVRRRPEDVARNIAAGYRIAFSPATQQPFVYANVYAIRHYEAGFSRWVLLQRDRWFVPLTGAPGASGYAPKARQIAWTLVAVYVLATLGSFVTLLLTRRRATEPTRPTRTIVLVMAFTVTYAIVVGQLLELGENSRFRFETDAIATVVAAWVVAQVVTAARGAVAERRTRRVFQASPSTPSATPPSTTKDGSAAARNRT